MYEFLHHATDDDGVCVVRLDRPRVNAVSQQMYREIRTLFVELAQDPRVRAVVLTGTGKHFCGGNDLSEFRSLDPENSPGRMKEVREAFWAIHDCPVPVIAAVHGVAVGTGLALVASCDLAVAAEGARLGVTEISVGVMGGARHLARLVPQPIVRWMFFTGDPVPVERIAALGGLVTVVAPERLMDEARDVARRIVRHSPVAVRYAKTALNSIESMDLKPGYEAEQALTGELCGFHDSKEAIAAFFEGREPEYSGS